MSGSVGGGSASRQQQKDARPQTTLDAGRASHRLTGRTVPVVSLDKATTRAAFTLFSQAYEATDEAQFEKDLAEKQHIILMRDARTGALKGFSTVRVSQLGTNGPGVLVFSGDTVIDPEYWGQKVLYRQFALLLLKLQVENPFRPVYWFLLSKGYKTYLIMMSTCGRSIPRWERPDEPKLRRLLDIVAAARLGSNYDPVNGVARDLGREFVRPDLEPMDESVLANPHVKFFVERNPDHARGDELACLAQIRLRDSLGTIWRAVRHRPRSRRQLG